MDTQIILALIGALVTIVTTIITTSSSQKKEFNKVIDSKFKDIDKKFDDINARLDKSEEADDALKSALQQSLKNTLLRSSSEYMAKGYCSTEEKQVFNETYTKYEGLGENGMMTTRWQKVMNLPDSKPVKTTKKSNTQA